MRHGGKTVRSSAALAARILGALLVAAVATTAWPSAQARAQAAQPKDTLTIGMRQFPSTLHPNIDSMMAKSIVLGMVMRPITAHDTEWQLVCYLCTELPTLSNGLAERLKLPDGRDAIRVTYTLQAGAVWGDGTPVTTRDVLFTWQVGKHPQSGVATQEIYRRIAAIEPRDDKTFTVVFDRVAFHYNNMSDFQLLPAHLEKAVFEASPADYRNKTLYLTAPTTAGLWFGPYRVTEFVPGSHVTVQPNPTWYGQKPHFRQIRIRTIENTAALEANLLSGDIDMIAGELGLEIDQGIAFESRHGSKYQIIFKPSLVYEHIDLNMDNPVLKDRRVRQGLLHAIDREGLTKALFGGYQPVAGSFAHPLDWIHDDKLQPVRFDAQRAAQLFDEAGFNQVKNGVRHNAAGQTLSFEIMTTAGNRTRERIQQVLQDEWKKVGVEIKIRNQVARVFFGQTVTQRQFTGMALYAWFTAPEEEQRSQLHSAHIPSKANNFGGQNFPGWSNPEADALIDKIEVELDVDRRFQLWGQLQRLYARELPVLPLFFGSDMHILPTWLEGVVPTGNQYPTTLHVESWKPKR